MADTSKMPAMIWTGPELVAATRTWGMHEYSKKVNASVAYVRADIAEQMAAALRDALRSSRKDFRAGPIGDQQHRDAYAEQFAALSAWEASNG